ncbi:MAG: hypothetical protein O7I42_26835 [Alphaproteobacteria bacterium]|nr:hypothetical protein [Alphaproteobacteria bacterium]
MAGGGKTDGSDWALFLQGFLLKREGINENDTVIAGHRISVAFEVDAVVPHVPAPNTRNDLLDAPTFGRRASARKEKPGEEPPQASRNFARK